MNKLKLIDAKKGDLAALSDFIQSYEELSASTTRKIKSSVLALREFLKGPNKCYGYVYVSKLAHISHVSRLAMSNINLVPKRPIKSLYVCLSSNTGLYGDIVLNVFKKFSQEIEFLDCDVLIVGSQGKYMFEHTFPGRGYVYHEISDYGYSRGALKSIYELVSKYVDVHVFHGYFQNVLEQYPQHTKISGELTEIESQFQLNAGTDINFIFEPSVEEVYSYFRSQISVLLFEQAVFESNLSKAASRMVNLDMALDKIKVNLLSLDSISNRQKHRKINKTLVSNLHHPGLWN